MFKYLPNQSNKELLNRIEKCESVAVHIRRGDFKNLAVLGTTVQEYYHKAIKYLSERLNEPVLFFFSDEMEWVKEKFGAFNSGSDKYYVESNTFSDSEAGDLRLMSNCKHNIIGNSTFGWWGCMVKY